MSDEDFKAEIDLTQMIRGVGGKPYTDMIGISATLTLAEYKDLPQMTLGRLLHWCFLEGIKGQTYKDVGKIIDLADEIENAMEKGKLIVTEGKLSQLEEWMGKVNHEIIQDPRYFGRIKQAFENAKGDLLLQKQKAKERKKEPPKTP